MPFKLFVGQVPFVSNEQQIKALFSGFGAVQEIYLLRDKSTGASKGAAFVTYNSKEEADLAIASLNDLYVMPPQTHTLQVRYAESQGSSVSHQQHGAALIPQQQYTQQQHPPQQQQIQAQLVSVLGSLLQATLQPGAMSQQQLANTLGAILQTTSLQAPPVANSVMLPSASKKQAPNKGGRKLFVGQFPRNTTESELLAIMQEFGTVDEIYMLKDKTTGVSKGAAFVTFSASSEAIKAIRNLDGQRVLPPMSNSMQVRFAEGESLPSTEPKLFVGMVPFGATQEDLQVVFEQFGDLEEVALIVNNGKAGAAFVRYTTHEACDAAIASLNGKFQMDGSPSPLTVKYAHSSSAGSSSSSSHSSSSTPLFIGAAPKPSPRQQVSPNIVSTPPPPYQHQQISQHHQHHHNHHVDPSLFLAQQQQQQQQTQPTMTRSQNISKIKGPPGSNLMVLHLPISFNDDHLYQLFQTFGSLLSAHVFIDPQTNLSKGFGFVSFADPYVAQQAISTMNGWQIGQNRLKVELKAERYAPY